MDAVPEIPNRPGIIRLCTSQLANCIHTFALYIEIKRPCPSGVGSDCVTSTRLGFEEVVFRLFRGAAKRAEVSGCDIISFCVFNMAPLPRTT